MTKRRPHAGHTSSDKPYQDLPRVADRPAVGARRKRATYLSPPDLYRLDWACRPIFDAFGTPPYLVGSVFTRPDYRDVDIRLILPDEDVERLFGTEGRYGSPNAPTPHALQLLFHVAFSDLIAKAANLSAPIDFQIQSMTEANVPEHGHREPIGIRWDIRRQRDAQ